MEFLTFEELQTRIQELYSETEFKAALDLATQQTERFPEHAHHLYYWRIVMAARIGDTEQALQLLEEILATGFWYGEVLLRRSPSLKGLQGMPAFERLVQRNRQLQEAEQEHSFPLITLRSQGQCAAGGDPCPMMLALHANASNARETVEFWRPAASAGWLVAVPQSTQAMWKDAYVWDNRETAEREIKKHYASLLDQYAVDPDRCILAGHSMGGETAIWLALTGRIPARAFIAFAPGGPLVDDLESWVPLIQENENFGLRGYIIMGDEDNSIPQDNVEQIVEMLNRGGIPCELERVPHAGHDFDPAFEFSLLRALEFVDPQ